LIEGALLGAAVDAVSEIVAWAVQVPSSLIAIVAICFLAGKAWDKFGRRK